MLHSTPRGVSGAWLRISELTGGTNTSSCSTLHVLRWCFACEMRHEWYGTSSAECSTHPTVSFSALLGENAPWPHSCASTHTPVMTQPCANQYRAHSATCAHAGAPEMRVAAAPNAAMTAKSHATCPSDRTAERSKQCAGTAATTSARENGGRARGGGASVGAGALAKTLMFSGEDTDVPGRCGVVGCLRVAEAVVCTRAAFPSEDDASRGAMKSVKNVGSLPARMCVCECLVSGSASRAPDPQSTPSPSSSHSSS